MTSVRCADGQAGPAARPRAGAFVTLAPEPRLDAHDPDATAVGSDLDEGSRS